MNAIIDLLLHPLLQLFRPLIATHSIERVADAINAAIDMGYRGGSTPKSRTVWKELKTSGLV